MTAARGESFRGAKTEDMTRRKDMDQSSSGRNLGNFGLEVRLSSGIAAGDWSEEVQLFQSSTTGINVGSQSNSRESKADSEPSRVARRLEDAVGTIPPEIPNTETVAPDVPDPELETVASGVATPAEVETEMPQTSSTVVPDNGLPEQPRSTKESSPSCNTLSCKGLAVVNEHPVLYIVVILVVVLIVNWLSFSFSSLLSLSSTLTNSSTKEEGR